MASETATQHSSRPECWYPNCYSNSRGIPQRVRYEVQNVGWCSGMVQGRIMRRSNNQQRDCLWLASKMVWTIFLVGADNLTLGENQWSRWSWMQANANGVSGTRCSQWRCSMADSLPRTPRQKDNFAKCEAWSGGCHSWPRQNTKAVGLPCIWGMVLAQNVRKLDGKAWE